MRPSVRVEVEETEHNLGHGRWLVVLVDTEMPLSMKEKRASVYAAMTEDEAIEVSHAVASTVARMWSWWGHDK